MMEDDSNMAAESKLTSIDNIIELLGSTDYHVVYSSVIQIKNLIIGNNKYKSHFLTDEIVRHLIRILQGEYALDSKSSSQPVSSNESEAVDLANQILIVFSSFSLGNLDHVTSLIRVHSVAETVFAALRTTQSRLDVSTVTGMSKQYTRLIESCLLCLSNLYSSSQLMPRLIYMLDKQLYETAVNNSGPSNLTSLIKYFHLSPRTKQSVLNVITISSANLMSTSCFMLRKETSVFKRYRAQLIKHDLVKLFAGLLTSFNSKLQLNCLKFYASIAFECVEATRQILTTHYYEFSLVDLIAAYLSRENPPELQLYAAKCLTNLYRSGLLIENDFSTDFMMDSDNSAGSGLMALKLISNQLIRAKTMPALVRLVVRFSLNYKNAFIEDYESPLDPASTQYTSNILYLIESISTLTYLIELNSDLQQIASYLEQILPTLVQNILYSFSNISTFRKKLRNVNLRKLDLITWSDQLLEQQYSADSASSSRRNKTINKTTNSSLFSLFYLIYNQFTSKGLHLKLNQHQYNLNSYKLSMPHKSTTPPSGLCAAAAGLDCWSRRKCAKFFRMFEINLYKYLISVSLHLMASLASNNEDSRRALTENSDLINKIVETIQLKSNKMMTSRGDEYDDLDEFVNNDDMKLNQLLENDDCDFDDLLIEFDDEESSEQIVNELALTEHGVESSTHSDNNNHLHHSITSTDSNLLRLSSLCLLHSLSRSVHQLRTKFLDNKLWNTIVELITRIYNKKLRLNEENARRRKSSKSDELAESLSQTQGGGDEPMPPVAHKYKNSKTVSNEEDDEDLLLNEVEMETETDLLDFSLNEKNLIAILFALVANLVIDFSPCKEMLINNNVIKILVEFIDSKNISIKVNSIWTLMNLAYQADQKVKQQILTEISMEKLFQLLTEQDETLVVKTVGLIRNLISHRPHVDYLMNIYGNKIIQAIIMILEGEYYSSFIKEQALCILANIADGATSKEFIMNNEDLLRKINSFMTHNYTELQVVALYCVSNLVNVNDEGSAERQLKLKEMGAHRILQKLSHSNDPILSEKVKSTLQHFANAAAIYSSSSSSTGSSAMI